MIKELTGRPPRTKDIIKTHELRAKGLSLLEISRIVLKRDDKKQINRWLKVKVGKTSK